ncbi:hypothetical protein BDR04DRAFT_866012 [Suillus decipiens]|nr:hypothetical protein BDR04DRAFT_866012 [Suillus decipiens]
MVSPYAIVDNDVSCLLRSPSPSAESGSTPPYARLRTLVDQVAARCINRWRHSSSVSRNPRGAIKMFRPRLRSALALELEIRFNMSKLTCP